jgi:hypothetical protein
MGERQSPAAAEPACRTMADVLSSLEPDAALRVDRFCRSQLPVLDADDLWSFSELIDLPDGWAVVVVLGFHRNGYVREHATRWLDQVQTGHEVPFLILRMNDWVASIRGVARGAMERRLRLSMAGALLRHIAMLRRLERWGRTDHAPFLKRAMAFLRRPDLAPHRMAALSSRDVASRHELFSLALAAEPHRRVELASLAARDPDRRVRRWALRQLQGATAVDKLEVVEFFLLDENLAHRQEAQLIARRLSPQWDLSRFYRDAMTGDERQLRAAVFGLGETGSAADVPQVLPLLAHPRTAIRRAALYAVAWLDMDGQADVVVEALDDPRRKVSNDAAQNLVRSAHLIPPRRARLQQLAASGSDVCRENAERVLAAGEAYRQRWSRPGEDLFS